MDSLFVVPVCWSASFSIRVALLFSRLVVFGAAAVVLGLWRLLSSCLCPFAIENKTNLLSSLYGSRSLLRFAFVYRTRMSRLRSEVSCDHRRAHRRTMAKSRESNFLRDFAVYKTFLSLLSVFVESSCCAREFRRARKPKVSSPEEPCSYTKRCFYSNSNRFIRISSFNRRFGKQICTALLALRRKHKKYHGKRANSAPSGTGRQS